MTPEFPSLGTKRGGDDATAGNSRSSACFTRSAFPCAQLIWLHGNASTNQSAAANWPCRIVIRPINVSGARCVTRIPGGGGGGGEECYEEQQRRRRRWSLRSDGFRSEEDLQEECRWKKDVCPLHLWLIPEKTAGFLPGLVPGPGSETSSGSGWCNRMSP